MNTRINQCNHLNGGVRPEQKISFTTEDGNCCRAKYRHWYNIEYIHSEHLSSTQGSIDLNTVKDLCTINDDTSLENDNSLSNEGNIIREIDEIRETNHLSFEADKIKSWKVGSRIWFTKKYLTASRNVFLLHGFVRLMRQKVTLNLRLGW